MAEAIANHLFSTRNINARALSFGVYAQDRTPASLNAIAAIQDYGLCLEAHKSRRITQKDLADAHMVIAMTARHKAVLSEICAKSIDKIHTFDELCNCGDITDPFGGDAAIYLDCAAQIKNCIENIDWEIYI